MRCIRVPTTPVYRAPICVECYKMRLTYSTSSSHGGQAKAGFACRSRLRFLQVERRIATLLQIFEIRSLPALARCFPRSFAFHVAHPVRSIETRSLPTSLAATHPGFAFYIASPKSSIPSIATCSMSRIPRASFFLLIPPLLSSFLLSWVPDYFFFETPSLPAPLAATLATLP